MTASPQPDQANLDEIAANAVITYQVAMVGPRIKTGLTWGDLRLIAQHIGAATR